MNRRRRLIAALSLSIPVPFVFAHVAEADLTVAAPQPQPEIAVQDPPPAPDVSVQPAAPAPAPAPDPQPAAPAEQVQPAAPAPEVQPAAPAPEVQPAAPAPEVQPAAPAPEAQPAAPAPDPQPAPPADTVQVAPPQPQPQVEVAPPAPQPDITPPPADPAPLAQDLQVAPPTEQPEVAVADPEPQPEIHVESAPDPNAQPVGGAALQGGDGAAVQTTAPAEQVQPAADAATVQDAAKDATERVQPTADPSRVDPHTPVAVADAPARPAHVEVAAAKTADTVVGLVKDGAETAVEGPGYHEKIRERAASQNGSLMKTSQDAETRSNSARSQARWRWDKLKVSRAARFFSWAGAGVTVAEDRLEGHSMLDSGAHAGAIAAGGEAGAAAGIGTCATVGLATEGFGAVPCAIVVVITGTAGGAAADKAYTKVRDSPELRRLAAPLAVPTTTSDPMSTSRFLRGLFAR